MPGDRLLQPAAQRVQFAAASHERHPAGRVARGGRGNDRKDQRRIPFEHRSLQIAQALGRVDAQVLHQRGPGVLVGLQRVGLAMARVRASMS